MTRTAPISLLVLFCALTALLRAQDPAPAPPASSSSTDSLPDSPGAVQHTPEKVSPAPYSPHQTKRILGVVPNFRSVSADTKLPPDSPRQKLMTGLEDSFDYSAFIFVGIQSAAYYGLDSTPQFHTGATAYGRYYWHALADYTDENLWVESLVPIVFHQDSRYYTLGRGPKLKRVGYALTRTVITRTDSGHETFNASEIVGAGIASGISSLYYPGSDRTVSKVSTLWLTNVLIDGGTFAFKEFWPDLNDRIFHQKY